MENRSGRSVTPVVIAGVVILALLLACSWYLGRTTALSAVDRAENQRAAENGGDKTAPHPYDTSLLGEDPAETTVKTTIGSQLSYVRLSDGVRMGTANERFARPALSIIKLYIADYVLREGSVEDGYKALDMIANSSDTLADELFEEYPESIKETARHYRLYSTSSGETWGSSLTSTYDMTEFLRALIKEDPVHPILVAMSNADKVAEDGYDQDFGTAKLDGVIGTKWGWSNNKDLHNSVSFGEDFVVAAGVDGSADDLSDLVKKQVTKQHLKEAEERAKTASHEAVPPLPTIDDDAAEESSTKNSATKESSNSSEAASSASSASSDSKKEELADKKGEKRVEASDKNVPSKGREPKKEGESKRTNPGVTNRDLVRLGILLEDLAADGLGDARSFL